MIKERAMMLADALESGDYQQGTGQLRSVDNKFCCLGVACNIFAQHHPEIAAEQESANMFMDMFSLLPPTVRDWFGFRTVHGQFNNTDGVDGYKSLVAMNDYEVDFNHIARVIREHWEEL